MGYIYLVLAIAFEVLATSALKASDGFTKLYPSIIVVIGYGASFYLLSLVLKSIPVGIAYAVWSGVGIVLISAIGYFVYQQFLDLPAMIGIALIVLGVLVIQIFSKSVSA